jgi:hypothetical protein
MNTTLAASIAIGVALVWSLIATLRFPGFVAINQLRDDLWRRYLDKVYPDYLATDPNDRTGADRLISYAERIIDRQINKARGILPFNSIVIAAFGFERGEIAEGLTVLNNVDVRFMLILAMALLALSSLLCLGLMLVRFGPLASYAVFSTEIHSTIHVVWQRSVVLEVAVICSIVALVIGALLIGLIEL